MNCEQRRLLSELNSILDSEGFNILINKACDENVWFTPETVNKAVDSIRTEILSTDKVEKWINNYSIPVDLKVMNVGIVMAGNIPLVGFFDLFCVLMLGYQATVKPSSKDSVLITYIAHQLSAKGFRVDICKEIDLNSNVDMLIATGGDDMADHFQKTFVNIPTLIRGDRYSVAILDGNESQDQILGLLDDIFLYWGFGCRNVSHVYLPKGYDLNCIPDFHTDFKPYYDNYRYSLALCTILGRRIVDKKGYLLVEEEIGKDVPISLVGYSFYEELSDINLLEDKIQCLVTNVEINFPRKVKFGETQKPKLNDYPDSKDVIIFLLNSQN